MISDRDLFALSLSDLLLLLQLVSAELQRRLVGPANPPVLNPRRQRHHECYFHRHNT